nr:PAS domain-containing protein [Methylopila sp. M107]
MLDRERLEALKSYGVLDTPAEDAFDQVVAIASEVCDASVALISLVDAERQWFKARLGFAPGETPLEQSVCAYALSEPDMLVIPDLSGDMRTCANPLVAGGPRMRFYAGAVLRSPDGHALGSLCVLDDEPRPGGLSDLQQNVLRSLARQVIGMLEMRRTLIRSVDDRIEQARAQRSREIAAASLQAHELKLRLAIDATRMGIFDYDLAKGELIWDARVRELFGISSTAPVTYETAFLAGVHSDDREEADAAVQAALDPRGPGVFDHEYRTVSPDGLVRWLAARGQSVVEDGRVTRFVGTVRDVTARRTFDDQIAATLERYNLISRVTKDVIWDWDLTSDHVVWNAALTAAYGHRLEDVAPTSAWWLDHVHPQDRERVRDDIFRVIRGEERDWSHEYRFRRADGSWADVFDRGSVIRDFDGRPLRMIGAMFDNSVRKAEEGRQRLLNHELSHRMKNLLTMVQAIANQTLRSTTGPEAVQEVLSGRLKALAKAQDILLGGQTEGAALTAIVEDAVRPHLDSAGRVHIAGPGVEIGSKAALPIVLMLHELATNALKYGALSTANGRVAVVWSVRGRTGAETLRLRWSESGGPEVAPPDRKGFGSRLIERGLAGQLGATVSLRYPSEGVVCDLEAPIDRLRAAD